MKHFILYANIKIVKGAKKSIIISYFNGRIYPISNDVVELIRLAKKKNVQDIIDENYELKDKIEGLFNFLEINHLGFYTSCVSDFPSISEDYESYSVIENAILQIDFRSISLEKYHGVINQLDELGAEFIELRFGEQVHLSQVNEFLNLFKNSNIMGIDIFVKYLNTYANDDYYQLLDSHQRISNLFIYEGECNKMIEKKHQYNNEMGNIFVIMDDINNNKCGQICSNSFQIGQIQNYNLNKKFNSCLYKKVSIDTEGNIKNCPSMVEIFGNISNESVDAAVSSATFQKYWNINKDKISICKHCEYRYICTDCRAFTEDVDFSKGNVNLSKPLKCGYDPYTGEWSDWATNPLKQKSIEFYDLGVSIT